MSESKLIKSKLIKSKLINRIETLHELESVMIALLPEFKATLIRAHEFHKPKASILKLWIEIKEIGENG